MDRQWSVWDELGLDYPAPATGKWRRDLRIHACQQRTAFLRQPKSNIAEEVSRRRAAWAAALRGELEQLRSGAIESFRTSAIPPFGPNFAAGTLLALLALMAAATAGYEGLALVLPLLILVIGLAWLREQRSRRLYRRLVLHRCNRCDYDFGGIPPERLPACPECGEPWPAIPPPAEFAARFSASAPPAHPAPPPAAFPPPHS